MNDAPSRKPAPCRATEARITAYLEGALTTIERTRFEAHCDHCVRCCTALAETRALVKRLGRLGQSAAALPAQGDGLLDLFREHGLHRPGPRPRTVPLGLGEARVAPGDHLAYLWESDPELEAAVGFVAAGVGEGDSCVLLGHEEANARLAAALGRHGHDVAALRRAGQLHLLSGSRSGPALLGEVAARIEAAVDRGERLVRVLGNLGWGLPGWPSDHELVCLEARVTAAIHKLPAVVMCAYDVRGTPASSRLTAGLGCHPWTVRRGVLQRNDRYLPAEELLGKLEG